MPAAEQDIGGDFVHGVAAAIGHRVVQFLTDDTDRLRRPRLPADGGAVQRGAAGQHRLGAERQRLGDVRAPAHAAVQDYRASGANRFRDFRQGVYGGDRAVHVAPTVVGHNDAVHAVFNGLHRVVGPVDPLHHQDARPHVAEDADIVPGQAVLAHIGNREWPGKVQKGRKMSGQYGNEQVTVKNDVLSYDAQNGVLVVVGSIPGANGALGRVKVVK